MSEYTVTEDAAFGEPHLSYRTHWILAALTFLVGDALTTIWAVSRGGEEGGLVAASLGVTKYGPGAIILYKLVTFGIFLGIFYYEVPQSFKDRLHNITGGSMLVYLGYSYIWYLPQALFVVGFGVSLRNIQIGLIAGM